MLSSTVLTGDESDYIKSANRRVFKDFPLMTLAYGGDLASQLFYPICFIGTTLYMGKNY